MGFFRHIAAVIIAIAASAMPAHATPAAIDATGLWVNSSEPGWGISLFHQGDTIFGSLFVYGPDGQPKWYTASRLVGGPNAYSGPLYRSTGPWFGERWDSDAVNTGPVGTMTFTLSDTAATVDYTIDGTHVVKPVLRFGIRPLNIAGIYYGVLLQPASISGTEKSLIDQHITITDDGARLNVFMQSDMTSSCEYLGSSRSQNGEVILASGQASVPPCSSRPGSWRMAVDPSPHGFVGNWSDGAINDGRIAAALRTAPKLQGTGWANDLWFQGNSPGWGFNFIEQGDGAFATLFVFDAQHQPHWYSASQLMAMGNNANGFPTWSGTLEESTGPYFGAAFDPSLVRRRAVGSLTFSVDPAGPANAGYLAYTVDGVAGGGYVNRFAFRLNEATGSYLGHVVRRDDDPRGLGFNDATFTFQDTDQYGSLNMEIAIDTGVRCTLMGAHSKQYGSQRAIAGNCTGSGLPVVITDFMVTANGFTATYSGPGAHAGEVITNGHISGARR